MTTDVREMRHQINKAMHGYERVDGKDVGRLSIPPAGAMIKNIVYAAQAHGWSGEDTMTVLAYEALKGYEGLYDRVLEHAMLTPACR